MGDNLAQLMFEAAEQERLTRGDFASNGPLAQEGRPTRWTELPVNVQDQWAAAAALARKHVAEIVLDDMHEMFARLQSAAPEAEPVHAAAFVRAFGQRWDRR